VRCRQCRTPHRPRTPINLSNPTHKTNSPHRAQENDMSNPDWTEAPTEATHYDCNADVFCNVNGWWSCKGKYYAMSAHFDWNTPRYTPRPVEPAPTAWDGEGVPPVGTECECFHRISAGKTNWVKCDVIGPYGDYVICAPNGGGFYGFDINELRPTRTQAQTERETLIRIATQVMSHDNVISERDAAEALYEAGMLKLPEGYRIEG